MTVVSFTIAGVPAPQGSKVRTRFGIREDNPATRPWRTAVAWEATTTMSGCDPASGPIVVELDMYFPRPKSHYGSGKNADQLKASAPLWCAKKPDSDKLARACLDAMSGIVYRDDAQVVDLRVRKFFGSPRADVRVCSVDTAQI